MNKMALNCMLAGWAALAMSGCGTPGSRQEAVSAAGAAVGAGVGLVAGAALHRPIEGMAAGALIGGGSGAVAGGRMDQKAEANAAAQQFQAAQARVAANPPVGKDDVIMMTKASVSEDVIVSKVNSASFVTPITSQDIVDMKNAGVSDKVMNAMLTSLRNQATSGETATMAPPPSGPPGGYYYASPYYVDPGPWPYVVVAPRYYPYHHPYYHRGRW